MALLAGYAQVLSFLHSGLLHQRVDPGIECVFMTTSKEGKQALIKRWMDRKKCAREEAMRLTIENCDGICPRPWGAPKLRGSWKIRRGDSRQDTSAMLS